MVKNPPGTKSENTGGFLPFPKSLLKKKKYETIAKLSSRSLDARRWDEITSGSLILDSKKEMLAT